MSFFSSWSFKLPPSIKSLLTNNPIYRNDTARPILFAIGAAIVATKTLSLASSLFSLISIPKNLSARYGKNTWAVITGASDGIGKAFALELAGRGFNIVLISRTEEKLNNAAKEIHKRCPDVQTKILVADFANAARDGFAEGIYEQVKDLDVSILVNNVGRGNFGSYVEVPIEKIREIVLINCLSHSLLTRVFLPHLTNRAQRSAIINISSLAAITPMPYYNPYCASKVYTDYLSRGLAYENSNIDILSVKPAGVSTAMNDFRKPDFRTLSTEEFVKAALGELGNTSHTYGHWKHKFQAWLARNMPGILMRMYLEKRMKLKKEREKKNKGV